MMSTATKWFASDMPGAPSISRNPGSLITVLDACLVNGFGTRTLSWLNVVDGIATAQIDNGHGFIPRCVVEISGATPSSLNGEKRVISATANQFTFETTESDGIATGLIAAKFPPLGWTKAFEGTHRAAYQMTGAEGSGCFLRVIDDGTVSGDERYAAVRGFEAMSSIDVGELPFPTFLQTADEPVLRKTNAVDSTPSPWMIFGDDRRFYLFTDPSLAYPLNRTGTFFGDISPFLEIDDHYCLISAANPVQNFNFAGGAAAYSGFAHLGTVDKPQGWMWFSRSYTGTEGAVGAGKVGETGFSDAIGHAGAEYPHSLDNGLLAARVKVHEPGVIRGYMPGIYQPLHARPLADRAVISGMADLPDRALMGINISVSVNWGDIYQGQLLLDVTGPW